MRGVALVDNFGNYSSEEADPDAVMNFLIEEKATRAVRFPAEDVR